MTDQNDWWSRWLRSLRTSPYLGRHASPEGGGRRPSRTVTLGAPTLSAGAPANSLCSTAPGRFAPLVAADGTSGPYVVRAASRAGRQHLQYGQSREDDFAVAATTDGRVVAAVADGVGDPRARYSATGAHVAVTAACRKLDACGGLLTPDVVATVVAEISQAMLPAAERLLGKRVRRAELATTLAAASCAPDGTYWGFSVGDGGLALLTDGSWESLLAEERALLNDVGGSLPNDAPPVAVVSGRLSSGEALLLATDGLLVPMAAAEVRSFLAAQWEHPPDLLDFIADLSFERRGEADDRTAVCLWFRPPVS